MVTHWSFKSSPVISKPIDSNLDMQRFCFYESLFSGENLILEQKWQEKREEVYIQQLQGYKCPEISNALFYGSV